MLQSHEEKYQEKYPVVQVGTPWPEEIEIRGESSDGDRADVAVSAGKEWPDEADLCKEEVRPATDPLKAWVIQVSTILVVALLLGFAGYVFAYPERQESTQILSRLFNVAQIGFISLLLWALGPRAREIIVKVARVFTQLEDGADREKKDKTDHSDNS